jgi:hypothetical protein
MKQHHRIIAQSISKMEPLKREKAIALFINLLTKEKNFDREEFLMACELKGGLKCPATPKESKE